MTFQEKIRSKQFVVTGEICPPKGTDITSLHISADALKGFVDAVNITDNQRSMMRMSSIAAAKVVQEKGVDVIVQVTCRDRNRIALQSDLLGAAAFGITNVLALTGDLVEAGDHPAAKPVFDIECVGLLEMIRCLNQGADCAGKALRGNTHFFAGTTVNQTAQPRHILERRMHRKITAGAQFFQTQPVYNYHDLEDVVRIADRFSVAVLGGVLLLKSAQQAHFFNTHVSGMHIPDVFVQRLTHAQDPLQEGIMIAAEQIIQMQHVCHGVHIMTLGLDHKIPAILDQVQRKTG